VVLIHPGKVVLPELGERLGCYAQEKLEQRGVGLRLETRVTGYEDEAVKLAPGEPVGTMSLIWTAGIMPAAALRALPVEKLNGRVKVNEFLEVAGNEGVVWAVGDCAAVPDGHGGVHPPTAQHGMREAVAAAKNIEAVVRGGAQKPFGFSTIGQLASIGHRPGSRRSWGCASRDSCLVALARGLPEQAARNLEEGDGGGEVVVGPAVPTRDRAVGDAQRCRGDGKAGCEATRDERIL
jgi:NADH dehydrogenase